MPHPFHVVRLGNRRLDQAPRRVQNATLGHRGRRRDPLYRIRKLMLMGTERLEGRGLERMLLGLRAGGRLYPNRLVCAVRPLKR